MSVRNLHQIVNRLDIMQPGSSAVLHTRQRPRSGAIRCVFTQTAQLWHNTTPYPLWCDLNLLTIDGVF
ncbi:hypothetical protein OQA07_004682 [Escherichia coli O4]|nr:hypothetical protein [Escherichia coli]EKK2313828.1 hypothetical protein [Escherichia coli O4]EIY6033988.1 hypothetical protein [Escherichia coli]EJC6629922.1 hypothetical protein [Escherichia coli]EJI1839378.1 hypothetical protein [Escherichia coli]